jgi:hypothetical protein
MGHTRPITGTPVKLAEFAGPLLPEWFDVIWRICILASGNTSHDSEIRAAILATFDQIPLSERADEAFEVTGKLFNATKVESEARWRVRLADTIAKIRKQHETLEIALEEAAALSYATDVEPDAKQCVKLADRIAAIDCQHPNQVDIKELEKNALLNATIVESDPNLGLELATRIAKIEESIIFLRSFP